MQNLAGHHNADSIIRDELAAAGIDVAPFDGDCYGEVPATIVGRVGPFVFHRLWVHWYAAGPMPLSTAERMYADPIGRETVRVAGDCSRPPPIAPHIETHRVNGAPYTIVPSYSIDTAAGLRLYADAARSVVTPDGMTTQYDEAAQGIVDYFAEHANAPTSFVAKMLMNPIASMRASVDYRDPRIIAIMRRCRDAGIGGVL